MLNKSRLLSYCKLHTLAITFILLFFFGAYSTFSLIRHNTYNSNAFDLGIQDQVIWHYSRFEAPASTIMGFDNALGDHFSPIQILAAPAFWVWNDVRSLLLLQALLVVLSAIPVYLLALNRIGKWGSILLTVSYLSFWGIQQMIGFDFHELAFSLPILSLALYFIEKEKYKAGALIALSLLLVKENLGLTVAAIGVYLLIKKQKRLGALLFISGFAWFGAMLKLVMPWLIGGGANYQHWSYGELGSSPLQAIKFIFTHPLGFVHIIFNNPIKVSTIYSVFNSFLWLPLLSPLAILIVPNILERMLSDNPFHWSSNFHYSAPLAPILAFAVIDIVKRFNPGKKAVTILLSLIVISSLSYSAASNQPLAEVFKKKLYTNNQVPEAARVIELIPSSAGVAAEESIVPHLSHRDKIYSLNHSKLPKNIDYIITNVGLIGEGDFEQQLKRQKQIKYYLGQGYGIEYSEKLWLILKRDSPSKVQLSPGVKNFMRSKPGPVVE